MSGWMNEWIMYAWITYWIANNSPATDHEDEDVKGNDVDEENVSAPAGHHVEVGHRAEGCPVYIS